MGCLMRLIIAGIFVLVIVGLCLGSLALFEYYSIASTLPSVEDLRSAPPSSRPRASSTATATCSTRSSTPTPAGAPTSRWRRSRPSPWPQPSPPKTRISTTIPATTSWPSCAPSGRTTPRRGQGGGASTITQQLARAILLTPEERAQRTYLRKAREIILAAEITRRYTKDQILELYLNEIYYGNLSYGIEAASETYFGNTADKLTLAQAAFLAGLPQSPAVYDIYTNRDHAAAPTSRC